jgi:RNA polymerase sigma factor (sigma-70 family)
MPKRSARSLNYSTVPEGPGGVHARWPKSAAQSAFLSPFYPHLAAATRYAARKVRPDEVEDVIQDSLLRIVSHCREIKVHHPKSYLMMVVRTVIVDRMRYETTRRLNDHCELLDDYHPADVLCPCRILTGRQELESAIGRLNAMPKRAREMLLAVRIEGASFKATAERYKVSISTVEKQVAAALAFLAAEA